MGAHKHGQGETCPLWTCCKVYLCISKVSKVSKPDIAVRNRNYHTATGNHMQYEITQCYLPPGRGDFPTFTPSRSWYSISDPGGMQGWVDLGYRRTLSRL